MNATSPPTSDATVYVGSAAIDERPDWRQPCALAEWPNPHDFAESVGTSSLYCRKCGEVRPIG